MKKNIKNSMNKQISIFLLSSILFASCASSSPSASRKSASDGAPLTEDYSWVFSLDLKLMLVIYYFRYRVDFLV